MSVGSSFVILCSSFFASILMQQTFFSAWPVISILVLAFYFGAINSFLGTIYQAFMKTNTLLIAALIGALITVVLTWVSAPLLGITGAAFAVFIGNAVIFVLRLIDSRRLLDFPINMVSFIVTICVLALQSVITLLHSHYYWIVSFICFCTIILVQLMEVRPFLKLLTKRLHFSSKGYR